MNIGKAATVVALDGSPVTISDPGKVGIPINILNIDDLNLSGGTGLLVNLITDLDNITDPVEGTLVGVLETGTYWSYNGTIWIDTTTEINNPVETVNGISPVDGNVLITARDIYGKILTINKNSTETIPVTPTLVTFSADTLLSNSAELNYEDISNAFLFNIVNSASYNIAASIHVTKSGATGTVGELNLLAFIEQYDEVTDSWSPLDIKNYSRRFVVASSGISSSDYNGIVRFNAAGFYRLRFYWWDSGSGTLANANSNINIVLPTGETIENSLVTTVTIQESIIN